MDDIVFSIIMPAYNSERTIMKSIDSVLNQSLSNWELITINDGSDDLTPIILEEFAEKEERIIVINQRNMGSGHARNNGILAAKGSYVAFLDSDDYWDSDFLLLIKENIQEANSDIIFYNRVYESPNGKIIRCSNISKFRNKSKTEIIKRQITGVLPWGMSKVIKRSLITSDALFTDIEVGEEAIFSFEVLNSARRIGFIEKPIYHYVQHGAGQHKKGNFDPWDKVVNSMREHLLDKDKEYLEKYSMTINSFAFRALCISCYRCAHLYPYFRAKKLMHSQIQKYRHEFNFYKLDFRVLEIVVKLLYPLIMIQCTGLVYLFSYLRKSY